jgi:hypothetical protein
MSVGQSRSGDVLDDLSNTLDDNIFGPMLAQKITGPVETTLLENIHLMKFYHKLHKNLKFTKIICAFFGICALGTSIGKGIRGNGGLAIIYAALAADLFRVSYNAYTKHYIIMLLRRMGSTENITKSVVSWATNALGLASSKDTSDPFTQINEEIQSDLLFSQTLGQKVVQVVYDLHKGK